ncbi:hypothetical protein HK105_204711 [Polyrhizophydium stewartii]|uniref:Uncharacterized protein n=1 Tax=Polyrhizophydium stewartii TaxID=2732419 RepID=A0ABR4N8I0_9FUNG
MSSVPQSHRQHGTIEEAMEAGYKMVEYHQHENNENFTVHIQQEDGGETMVYTNIGVERMQKLAEMSGLPLPVRSQWKEGDPLRPPKPHERADTKAMSFADCVKDGGKLESYHETERGTYSVHIRTRDGKVHVYTSVSLQSIEELPGFEG